MDTSPCVWGRWSCMSKTWHGLMPFCLALHCLATIQYRQLRLRGKSGDWTSGWVALRSLSWKSRSYKPGCWRSIRKNRDLVVQIPNKLCFEWLVISALLETEVGFSANSLNTYQDLIVRPVWLQLLFVDALWSSGLLSTYSHRLTCVDRCVVSQFHHSLEANATIIVVGEIWV